MSIWIDLNILCYVHAIIHLLFIMMCHVIILKNLNVTIYFILRRIVEGFEGCNGSQGGNC